MLFSEIIETLRGEGTECLVDVSEDWGQGRAIFGGLVAAVGNEAMRRVVPRDRVLRSLNVTFVGPAPAGSWRIVTQVLRVGRAVTTTQCAITADGEAVATIVGVYGNARPSRIDVPLRGEPPARKVDELVDMPTAGAHLPRFIQHFAVRWIEDPGLFSGVRTPGKAFLRHRDPAPTTESHIVALTDCLPPVAMSMCAPPAPASSLVWTLEFVSHRFDFPPDAWWRLEHDMDAGKDGYTHESGILYDPEGTPVALSRQLVAVFG